MRWMLALLLLTGATPAHADEAERAAVERAFLEGRLNDLSLLETADGWTRYARYVRDRYWRQGGDDWTAEGGPELLVRRRAWIRKHATGDAGPYPTADDDPLPILTALIVEREQRERDARIDATPIRDLKLTKRMLTKARRVGLDLLEVHARFVPNAEDLASADRADALATRNAWLGLGAVLLLVVACVVLAARLGRRPQERAGGDGD